MKKRISDYLGLYLLFLFLFSAFYLFIKYKIPNDSTISEWLINYEGGFTKRGIIGQLAISLARFFNQDLRWIIYLLQISTCLIYFILIYNFLKNINYNRTILLAIFSPIFLLYPIAEIEVLARKEVLVFSLYLFYLFIPNTRIIKEVGFIIFFTLSILIWEPIIFFIPIFFMLEIIINKIENIDINFIKIFSLFFPGIILGLYIAFNPLTKEEHNLMSFVLKNEFGESCYMSCALLKSKSTIIQQFAQYKSYTFEIFVRYILIIIIGFGPLFLLLKNSKLKFPNVIFIKKFNNLFFPVIILLSPVLFLFAMGYDWGRWVNITYVLTVIFYFYLYKNDYLILNSKFQKNFIDKLSKKIFITLFIVFCFGWNPKTTITGDVASFPGYRIPYKVISYFVRGHF